MFDLGLYISQRINDFPQNNIFIPFFPSISLKFPPQNFDMISIYPCIKANTITRRGQQQQQQQPVRYESRAQVQDRANSYLNSRSNPVERNKNNLSKWPDTSIHLLQAMLW